MPPKKFKDKLKEKLAEKLKEKEESDTEEKICMIINIHKDKLGDVTIGYAKSSLQEKKLLDAIAEQNPEKGLKEEISALGEKNFKMCVLNTVKSVEERETLIKTYSDKFIGKPKIKPVPVIIEFIFLLALIFLFLIYFMFFFYRFISNINKRY